MDRKKPSLTSPGKVGFLVALLMVVTALGVSYLITGTFGVTWHWIHAAGLSPTTWTFNIGAFFEEMAPLLVLTALLAFAAHVLVAGAVRRYKVYVDSGAEYKQLLKSIKSIEDLEDDNIVDRLKQHPELREFLLGVKHRVAAHERQNGERERRPANAQSGESRAAASEERSRWQSESATLASAIAGGRDAFPSELALTVPDLKKVERALRDLFAGLDVAPVAAPPVADETEALRASLRSSVSAMRRDVEACANGARELEAALGSLGKELRTTAKPARTANVDEIRKRVDATAEALAALGEETKRIAIAAAMQASGDPEASAIKVAEELRTLATRFNKVAQHWRQTAPGLNELLGASTSAGGTASQAASEAVVTAVTRARLWSERTVAINEHVRALESAIRNNGDAPAAEVASPAAPLHDEIERTPIAQARRAESATEPVEDFLSRGTAQTFASGNDTDVAFADIPGFEKEPRIFASDSPQSAASTPQPEEGFVVDNAAEARWDLANEAAEEVSPEPAPVEPARQPSPDADGFLTGPRPVVSPKKIAKRPEPKMPRFEASEPVPERPVATATLDADADAVDLYELGAVDCVQTG